MRTTHRNCHEDNTQELMKVSTCVHYGLRAMTEQAEEATSHGR